MTSQIVSLSIGLIALISFLGVFNYLSTIKQGKEIYCKINCKDTEPCDFMEPPK